LKTWLLDLLKQNPFWALTGTVLGFILAEGSRALRDRRRIRRLKTALCQELRSILAQIPQKVDIVNQMMESVRRQRILPGLSVPILDMIYKQYGPELYPYLSLQDRNCLHVIYERLLIADTLLGSFEEDLRTARAEAVIQDSFQAYHDRLSELLESYKVVEKLIQSYLSGKPIDVFYVSSGGMERRL
jgi:uncharacterized membrane protein YccC